MRDVMDEVQRWIDSGDDRITFATVMRTFNSAPRGAGAKMAIGAGGKIAGSVSGGCVEASVIEESSRMTANSTPKVLHFQATDESAWAVGLPCGGGIDVLVEPLDEGHFQFLRAALLDNTRASSVTVIDGPAALLGKKVSWTESGRRHETMPRELARQLVTASQGLRDTGIVHAAGGMEALFEAFPPLLTLVIVGGVHIAVALSRLAKAIGYRTVVIDPRKTFGSKERFPEVDRLLQSWPEEAYAAVQLTPETAVAVLTHDPKIDDPALAGALRSPAFYVGALGSRRSQEKRGQRLRGQGFTELEIARIRGPIGLDIGAANPEEIALAILSEVVAVSRRGTAAAGTANSLTNESSRAKIDR